MEMQHVNYHTTAQAIAFVVFNFLACGVRHASLCSEVATVNASQSLYT